MAAFKLEAVPWLGVSGETPVPETPAAGADPSPAQRLLHAHLSHGSRARREAASFALALTQPAAAAAVRSFLQRNKPQVK